MGLRKSGPLPLIWGLKNLKTWANFDPMICQFYPTIIFNFRCFTVKIYLVFKKGGKFGVPCGEGPLNYVFDECIKHTVEFKI
jgi:hypothetical protein